MFSKRASAITLLFVLCTCLQLFCRSLSNLSSSSYYSVGSSRVSSNGAVNYNFLNSNCLNYYRVRVSILSIFVTTTANHGYAEKNSK